MHIHTVAGVPTRLLTVPLLSSASEWGWGPETFAAMATVGLAIVTAALVWMTRGVVTATHELASRTQAETEAAWRPVLLAQEGLLGTPGVVMVIESDRIAVGLRNVGRGPALATMIEVDGDQVLCQPVTIPHGEPASVVITPGRSGWPSVRARG